MTCPRGYGLGAAQLAPFQGPKGDQGERGDIGETGPVGDTGPIGPPGPDPGADTIVAGQPLGGQRVVGLGIDGRAVLASSANLGHYERVLGVTLSAADENDTVAVRRVGPISDPSWSFAIGPIWLGTDGNLTQAAPGAGFLQQIAFATEPTRIFVLVGEPVILANPET